MRTQVTAKYLLGHQDGRHQLLRDASVVFEGDTVVYVGTRLDGPVDEHLDLGESLILPGLIDLDALCDIDHVILDSWADPDTESGLQWSEDYFRTRRHDVFSVEERAQVREYALVQLALHGITTFMPISAETHSQWAESYEEAVSIAEQASRLGLRGFVGPAFRSGVNVVHDDGARDVLFEEQQGERGLEEALRFLDWAQSRHDPLLTGVLLPCRIETMTRALLESVATQARDRGVLVRLHALQGLFERELILAKHGMTPLELIKEVGLLGPTTLIPHAIFTDRDPQVHGEDRGDLALLADAGVTVIHCPLTSLRYGSVLHSFRAYRQAGVNLALGTDSFPPDLVRGMDVGVHLAKYVDGRQDAAPVEWYVEAATLGGARALGRADLGRLAPGAQADLVAFSLNDIRDGVVDDPIRTLLLNGAARQVTHSFVAGRAVVVDGRIPGVDLEALRHSGQRLFEKMRAAYSERDHRGRSVDQLFPPAFPPLSSAVTR
ncbi:N-ethylammeline chlorohydrolase [Humibacillus sp. DSM 29435]|uniref:chlorohydrolase family protein n=1 Tax=Humibacillus sp. DSM 29435 TaxID=1869167 RepID=UPI000871DF70|nr:chlorohydrolase family protein [Humibacillus sp. DSM 29435]OFE14408.1 N-ethylammeline chlorohydrolase [Humibacillus sp. DSM 29435]